ncbi:MAG: cytidylate kinase family protein [Thermodesulfovibrionales bacterium]
MAILTISREFGSGGREIGEAVARELGYAYVDKERLHEEIRKAGHDWEKWSRTLDEHCPTVWERHDWSFRGFGALLQSVLLEFASADRVVLMGRGGNFLLQGIPYSLSVRVVAPLEQRLERIMKRESVDRETARWLAEKTDASRACFIQTIYGQTWNDPANFDMTIDTADSPIGDIVAMLTQTLARRDTLNTSDAREELGLRAVAARVRAAIATDPAFFVPVMDVFVQDKSIVLRGVVHTPKEHRRIEDAARTIAGDVPVRCELHYRG